MIFDDEEQRWSVVATSEIQADDANSVFLVDHAWTFRPSEARQHLDTIEGLKERLRLLMDIDDAEQSSPEHLTQLILERMWRYCHTYSISVPGLSTEDRMPVWYVRDEFGSRIAHGDPPSARLVPLYYAPQLCAYSLLFVVRDIQQNVSEEITVDYAEGETKRELKDLYLLPWFEKDVSQESFLVSGATADFYTQNREMESLPETTAANGACPNSSSEKRRLPLKVFADSSDQIVRHLTDAEYEVTDRSDDADVLWLTSHFKDFRGLSEQHPTTLVNQFPCESVLTVKDLLAAAVHGSVDGATIAHDSLDSTVPWFAVTFNLQTELPQFVSYYQNRSKRNLDNTWVVKPWNLARGLDTHVSDNLAQIIRLIDSGPKIACKYIEHPVLFNRPDNNASVKFDLRFIVFVKSVKPLTTYIFNNFWLRFAYTAFSLDQFDVFDKHFTVFNYADKDKLLQMRCEEFIRRFEEQNPGQNWSQIMSRIRTALRESLQAATALPPPRGVAPNRQSRAMYGVDVMLKWNERDVVPVILEYNFMPDCARACDYYPEFANMVFETLFLSQDAPSEHVTLL